MPVIKDFRLHLPNTKQIRCQNLELLKVLRTFQKKVGIFFRESLLNLFLAIFSCLVKVNSKKSASNESIAKSWEILNRNYEVHHSYVWIFKEIYFEFHFGFIVYWWEVISLKVCTAFHVLFFVPRSTNVRYDTLHFLSFLDAVNILKKNPVTVIWETNKVIDYLKIPFNGVPYILLAKRRISVIRGRYAEKI